MRRIKNQNDVRALRSKKKLKAAYIRLAGLIDRDQINVSIIANEAGLNRGTFYDNYNDIDKILYDIEKDAVNNTVEHIVSETRNKKDLTASLKGLAESLDVEDPGHIRLFFDQEYNDFQMIYMDDVLSSSAFKDVIGDFDCQWILKGYLSAFLPMYNQWRQGKIEMNMDEFVEHTAELFERGLNGIRNY